MTNKKYEKKTTVETYVNMCFIGLLGMVMGFGMFSLYALAGFKTVSILVGLFISSISACLFYKAFENQEQLKLLIKN